MRAWAGAVGDEPGDLLLVEEGLAEVAAQHAREPYEELQDNRPIEPELLANIEDILRGRRGARDDGGGIAGVSRNIAKTSTATIAITGMVASKRRAR